MAVFFIQLYFLIEILFYLAVTFLKKHVTLEMDWKWGYHELAYISYQLLFKFMGQHPIHVFIKHQASYTK